MKGKLSRRDAACSFPSSKRKFPSKDSIFQKFPSLGKEFKLEAGLDASKVRWKSQNDRATFDFEIASEKSSLILREFLSRYIFEKFEVLFVSPH